MILFKNKGFSLLEVLIAIALTTLGFLLISSLASQIAYYTAKTRILFEGTNKDLILLDQHKIINKHDGAYEVCVKQFADERQITWHQVLVAYTADSFSEHISLITYVGKGSGE